MRYRRILHATDFSTASGPALAEAVRLAREHSAELAILHVLVPPSPFVVDELPSSYLELEASARREAERRLAAAVATASNAGVRAQPRLLVGGAPADEIVRAARRWPADLIVIGTHGRTGLGRLFMGSVAERVLQRAPCPVLTVHHRGRARRRGAAGAGGERPHRVRRGSPRVTTRREP
jgi:nucleotide-binding universal stress UspA family protein